MTMTKDEKVRRVQQIMAEEHRRSVAQVESLDVPWEVQQQVASLWSALNRALQQYDQQHQQILDPRTWPTTLYLMAEHAERVRQRISEEGFTAALPSPQEVDAIREQCAPAYKCERESREPSGGGD